VFFFPGATFSILFIGHLQKFPGGLKVKRTAQVIQGDQEL